MNALQKFQRGDRVRIAKDLGPHMRHFPANCEATVLYSYKDWYGGDDIDSFALQGDTWRCSWYYSDQLTLIEEGK